MAPRKKGLNSDIFLEAGEDLVQCKPCAEVTPSRAFIKSTSAAKHLDSQLHINNVAVVRRREDEAAEHRRRIAAFYAAQTAPNPAFSPPTPPPPRPSMFDRDAAHPNSDFFDAEVVDSGMRVDEPLDIEAERRRVQAHFDFLLEQAYYEDEFGGDEDGRDGGDDVDVDIGEDEMLVDEDEDDNEGAPADGGHDGKWKPYPSKISMLLDIVDNLPRLRLSSAHLRIILWLLKECGVRNVPSYDKLRKIQSSLTEVCGAKTIPHKSFLGNRFFTNNIAESIALDFANPEIAEHLQFYPEETAGPISEVWQAERWKEFPPEERTPMFSRGLKRFFIEELCRLSDGTYVIPHDWVIREILGKKCLTARCSVVCFKTTGLWAIMPEKRIVPSDLFEYTYEDVVARVGDPPKWEISDTLPHPPTMPNPLRDLAPDCDIYVVMVPFWCDDVSGNKSKQYNKHINTYMANSNLPGRLLQQEFFVRFVSTSPHATSPEQFAAVRDQINATHTKPIHCFNASTKRECAVILRVPALPADNPQQSEEASHIGGNGNHPCRKCEVGGAAPVKGTDDYYHAFHYAGIARTAAEIRKELDKQLETAMLGNAKAVKRMQTASGTKDKITQHWIDILLEKAQSEHKKDPERSVEDIVVQLRKWLQEQPGDKMNPLLDIAGLDPSQDTPVEILHTILLGVVKYVWYILHTSWSEEERQLFTIRLQSTDIDGLSIPSIRAGYMMQYRNNLIGKDFKTIMQTSPFHVHGMSEASDKHPDRFTLLKAVGELGAVLWMHTIDDMDQFCHDVEILTGNVLDAFDVVDCKRITTEIKLHLLPHLVDDIRRFGPAIRNSTEVFECFNAVFRLCSVLSNHHAPSRDIAIKLSSFDRVKHILSGGYWQENGQWVQGSKAVCDVLRQQPVIQRHLGWVPSRADCAGEVTTEARRIPPRFWSQSHAGTITSGNICTKYDARTQWRRGSALVARSGDSCKPGSWIFSEVKQDGMKSTIAGRIKEILVPIDFTDKQLGPQVLVEVFDIGQTPHPDFHAPVLCRPADVDRKFKLLEPTAVLFIFSAQHDCRTMGCDTFSLVAEVQEHEATTRQRKVLQHVDDDHFIVNIYGIHNAVELRRVPPRELTQPVPLFTDRRAHHDAHAAKRRASEGVRRQRNAQRRLERKKMRDDEAEDEGDLAEGGQEGCEGGDEDDEVQDQAEQEDAEDGGDTSAEEERNNTSRKRKRAHRR
ncbi:hypothetical protein FB107DRAFT_289061 [Schizophyllum commune]